MYFGELNFSHKFLPMYYNINIRENFHTTKITEIGLNFKQHTSSSRPKY